MDNWTFHLNDFVKTFTLFSHTILFPPPNKIPFSSRHLRPKDVQSRQTPSPSPRHILIHPPTHGQAGPRPHAPPHGFRPVRRPRHHTHADHWYAGRYVIRHAMAMFSVLAPLGWSDWNAVQVNLIQFGVAIC